MQSTQSDPVHRRYSNHSGHQILFYNVTAWPTVTIEPQLWNIFGHIKLVTALDKMLNPKTRAYSAIQYAVLECSQTFQASASHETPMHTNSFYDLHERSANCWLVLNIEL